MLISYYISPTQIGIYNILKATALTSDARIMAKVIDGGADNAKEGLVDPMRLMEEMNASGIMSGPRGIIGLIDVSLSCCAYML